MSKIQNIQPKYQPSVLGEGKAWGANPSFASAANPNLGDDFEKIVLKSVGEKVDKKLGKTGWVAQKLSDTKGELQTQLINNLFTGTLAPIVIAWNPISKDDQKTKYYSAWRQPISVCTAMAINFPLTMLFNSYIDRLGSVGAIKSLDCRISPEKSFLKSDFKTTLNELKKNKTSNAEVKAFLSSCNDAAGDKKYIGNELYKSDGVTPTKKYKNACITGYANKVSADRKALFLELIGEHPDNIVFDKGIIAVKTANGSLKELGKNIPGFEDKAQFDAYIKENNVYKKSTRDFMKEEFKFEFFEDGELKPSVLEDKLAKTKAMDFMRKFGIFDSGKITEDDLRTALNIHRQKGKFESAIEQSGVKNPVQLANAIGTHTSREIELSIGEGHSSAETINLHQLFGRLNLEGKKLQEFMNKTMAQAQMDIAKELKEKKLKDFDNKTVKDFATNILANKIKTISKNFGNYKAYFGIFTNVFILAATCTALNWIYPRFMEIFLPGLAEAKKKGGNK